MITPILFLGAGNMGGAIVEGWLKAGAFAAADLMIVDPRPGKAALAAEAAGAVLNPDRADYAKAKTVMVCVKPQIWREAAGLYASSLAKDAVIVSVVAGVGARALAQEFGGRTVARVIPTTAVAINRGTASLYAEDPTSLA